MKSVFQGAANSLGEWVTDVKKNIRRGWLKFMYGLEGHLRASAIALSTIGTHPGVFLTCFHESYGNSVERGKPPRF